MRARYSRFSIVLCSRPLTILLSALFLPRLPAFVASRFSFCGCSSRLVLCYFPPRSSSQSQSLSCSLAPVFPVPRHPRRLTFRFDVLGLPPPVFNGSRLTFSNSRFPLAFVSLLCVPSKLLLRSSKPQCRFSAAEQVRVQLDFEDLLLSLPLSVSPRLIHFIFDCLRVPVHVRSHLYQIVRLLLPLYTLSTSIDPYLPRYSLRDPSSHSLISLQQCRPYAN